MSYSPHPPHPDGPFTLAMTDDQRALHRPGRGKNPHIPFGRTLAEAYHIEEVTKNPMGHYWKWTIRRSEDRDL